MLESPCAVFRDKDLVKARVRQDWGSGGCVVGEEFGHQVDIESVVRPLEEGTIAPQGQRDAKEALVYLRKSLIGFLTPVHILNIVTTALLHGPEQ